MAQPDQQSWADAISMYERRYTIAKVTRRLHRNWALDVHTLMHEATEDHRGWRVNDPLVGEFERREDPFYPFADLPDGPEKAEAWLSHVTEIPRSSAKRFLVALSTTWLNVERTPHFEQHRADLERKADVILSRFPEGSRFYANTGRDSAQLDYYRHIPGCDTVSVHTWDLGLVLVSDTEVGMVWSFDSK